MGKKKPRGKQREDDFPETETEVGTQPKGRKSKKDRLADPFFDEVPTETPSHEAADAEGEEPEESVPMTKPKKKKNKPGKAETGSPEGSEDEEGTDNAAELGVEDEGEVPETAPKKKNKKKNKTAAFESAFAALEGEEDGGSVSEEDVGDVVPPANDFEALQEDDEEEPELLAVQPKKKDRKKKKSSAFESAFAALEEEETDPAFDKEGAPVAEDVPEQIPQSSSSKKKSKQKKKSDMFESAFAALEEEESQPTELQPEETPKKAKKKKKGALNFDELMTEMNGEEAEIDRPTASVQEPEPAVEVDGTPSKPPPEPESAPDQDLASSKDKKKAKKKKKGKEQKPEEDIDAILAEIDGAASREVDIPAVAPPQSEPESQAAPSEPAAEKVETEPQEPVEETRLPAESSSAQETPMDDTTDAAADGKEVKLTEAQKKKLRKKEKKAKEKAKEREKEAQNGEESSKKKEKVPAHLKKIHEQLEKKRLEEERLRLEQEAEKARLAEEERLREEAERQKEEEARKKAEARAKKEELRKQGLLLTKKQKADQARMAVMREQLLKNAGISRTGSGAEKTGLTPQEQKRIQKEREEEKRKAEAERLRAEEEQKLREEEEQRRNEAAMAEQRKREEEEKKRQEEEDAIADNWEDLSEEEEETPAETAPVADLQDQASASSEASESESSSEEDSSESDSDSDSGSSSYSEDSDEIRERQVEEARKKVEARIEEAKAEASADKLRSPICCILGHVDTGKTKILDNIRKTNVQDNEAGGITQQIGATYIPSEALQTRTADLRKGREYDMKVPGLLVIDTPGHESFTNLRTRGSSLCDIAILVVDLMHGLEAQTVESIELLRQKNTPFIICLNKVDRLNDWKVVENAPIRETLNRQKKHTMLHFEDRLQACSTMLMERGLNVALYWKNKEPRRIVNMVPTSAITGEGIPDMLQLLIKLTTSLMAEKLMFLKEIQCSVLEVKAVEGLGTTIDVVLVNGQLTEGDRIVVCGMSGPIVTTIRSLLTPHPLKELRVKGSYLHHKSIQAAQGIKLCAQNLEHAVAGTALRVVRDGDEEECKLLAQEEMEEVMSRIDKSGEGVSVQASTLGSLEALLEFLKTPEVSIPVSAIAIGPVHKKDVMRANVMNEKKLKKFAVVLAFDVPVTREAREMSEELNVKIFTADIIYHLFDQFKAYVEDVRQAEKRAASADAVFPCVLSILPTCIFNKKDPIILGCDVKEGQARVGTPLVVPAKPGQGLVALGRIESMELNHKSVQKAQRGDSVAVKIQSTCPEEAAKLYGRHFDHTDQLVSHISRESIDALKAFFKDEMSTEDWNLVIKLKKVFQVE